MNLRSMFRSMSLVVGLSVVASGIPRDVHAADKRPLPPSIVQAVDGPPRPLSQLASDGKWLFVYILPDSPASARLLKALATWQLTSLNRIAIIVGGDKSTATTFAKGDRGLPGVQWALDPDRTAWKDLQLTGVPALFGVRDGLVEWRLAGVLNDPTALQSIITDWTAPTMQ